MAHHRTLTQMRTAVRNFLDESSASFWTNAQVDSYLNRAKDRVQIEVRRLKDDFFTVTRSSTDGSLTILSETYAASGFQIPVGSTTLTLPPDFAEMKLIEVITSNYEQVRFVHRDLAHPDMRAAMELTDNLLPDLFYFDIIGERTLRWAPKSDTALDLRLTYVQFFADLSQDSDELTMPFPLYLAVEHYAIASAMMQDRDPNAAAHEARAKQIIAEFTGAHARQTQDVETAIPYLADW